MQEELEQLEHIAARGDVEGGVFHKQRHIQLLNRKVEQQTELASVRQCDLDKAKDNVKSYCETMGQVYSFCLFFR